MSEFWRDRMNTKKRFNIVLLGFLSAFMFLALPMSALRASESQNNSEVSTSEVKASESTVASEVRDGSQSELATDKGKSAGAWQVVGHGIKRNRNHGADAKNDKFDNWIQIAEVMGTVLDEAQEKYEPNNEEAINEAYNLIDKAYFRYYETQGFEKNVLNFLPNGRVNVMEALFRDCKRMILNSESSEEVSKLINILKNNLVDDAKALDGMSKGKSSSAFESFFISFTLMLREGLEAILVIAALIAYLVKTNNKKYLKHIYIGAVLGIVSSIILAIVFSEVSRILGAVGSGRSQEIFEGVTMLLAVVVLFWVSNWMLNKSEIEEWNKYIHKQVQTTITTGSVFALVFSAWIAVAREGAELVLFYQGLLNNNSTNHLFMWIGLAVAVIALAIIFVLFRVLSVKLPLKPFFYFTSIVMFVLCFSFIGKGIHEFQEANVIPVTHLIGKLDESTGVIFDAFSVDLLGIYDRIQNLVPQLILIIITVLTFVFNKKKRNKIDK